MKQGKYTYSTVDIESWFLPYFKIFTLFKPIKFVYLLTKCLLTLSNYISMLWDLEEQFFLLNTLWSIWKYFHISAHTFLTTKISQKRMCQLLKMHLIQLDEFFDRKNENLPEAFCIFFVLPTAAVFWSFVDYRSC